MSAQYRKFSSYNGLDRVALIAGIPLIPFILLGTFSVFISFIAQYFLGIIGFAFLLLFLPIFLFLRQITETDDKALRIFGLEFQSIFKRRLYKEFGNTLTFLPSKYLRNEKCIKQNFENSIFHD